MAQLSQVSGACFSAYFFILRYIAVKKSRVMPELILQLKAVKADRGLSNQDIFVMLQESGHFLSLSTIKRVFADGSEHASFRYDESVRPIEELLLVETPPLPVDELESIEEAQQYVSQIEALQAAAVFKDDLLEELRRNNATLQASIEKQEATIERMEKTHTLDRKKLFALVMAIIIETLLVFLYLIIHDAPNPNYGILPSYFATQETAATIFGDAGNVIETISALVRM